MKYFFVIFFLFVFSHCARNDLVYWCGDHACINNKERAAYFKETMIVEMRDSAKKSSIDKSKAKDLKKQSKVEEKKLKKQAKIEKKIELMEKRDLKTQAKLEKKINKKYSYKDSSTGSDKIKSGDIIGKNDDVVSQPKLAKNQTTKNATT